MAKGAFSAHLHAVLEHFRVAKYVPNAVMLELQQQSDIRCRAHHQEQALGCFRDPAQWLAGILLEQLASQGTCLNSQRLQDAVKPRAFNRHISFTSQCCPPCVNAEVPFCFEKVVITTHPAAEHRWLSGLTSPAAGFAAGILGQAVGSAWPYGALGTVELKELLPAWLLLGSGPCHIIQCSHCWRANCTGH